MNLVELIGLHVGLFLTIGLLLAVLLLLSRIIHWIRERLRSFKIVPKLQQTLMIKRPRQIRSHASH